ncbi:hypothetical protein OIU78_014972 [Salix suchowensis]|nr:hypothetical protein OIU78_014972 [Salix suchowensis]
MSGFVGVLVSDPWLQSQFTQVELRSLKSKFVSTRTQSGRVTVGDLPPIFVKLRAFTEMFDEDGIKAMLGEAGFNMEEELDFESFLKGIETMAEKLDCKGYLTSKDIVEGSPNLNLAFVAQIFQHRNGLSADTSKMSFAEMMTDDAQTSREERCFRLWINSLGTATYVNNVFEDIRNGWVLLEVLDKVSPGSVNWKLASKPPIKMPFRKVENCNQVIQIGKDLCFSLVNVAGNDIVQGNKKLILAYLWQLMRFTMLQLLKNLRYHSSHSRGKEITDADILKWANNKVKKAGRTSRMESFKDKSLSNGIFFLELLSAVEPRVVNWTVVTKGETDEDKKLNATYIISVARKLGCSIFLLPEDIIEVGSLF